MDKVQKDKILQQAINQNGVFKQIEMLYEEMGELMTAINKVKRVLPNGYKRIPYPHIGTSVDYSLRYFNLCSEVADCKILIEQMEVILCKEAIDISEDRKLIRLQERLNNNTY